MSQPEILEPSHATDRPLISVVIPAYNAQAHLGECLHSVLAQSGAFQLETLVVDDGSQDSTPQIASQINGVQCIVQPNRGPSAARNTGIAAARGEFIAFLDADDLWPEGKLEVQLQALQRHPEAALVVGDCRQFDAHGLWSRTEYTASGLGAASWGSSGLVPRAYAQLLENNFITTGSVVVRRAALLESSGFAEDLRLVEDLDLWLRIARRHPIAWCPQECLLRRRHNANISGDQVAIGLAYLQVLSRHAASWGPGEAQAQGVNAGWLASNELLHLADLALARGETAVAWRRLGHAVSASPRPVTAWRAAKTAVKLGLHGVGLRA